MRKFEARRQSDTESLVEFEQALRSLFKVAWPTASSETRDATLKRRFEDGVLSSELLQYLRLHHRDLTFEQTVEKARIYHSTMDSTKPKKAIRFVAEPDADPNLLLVNHLKAIEGRLDKVIKDNKPTSASTPPPSPAPSSTSTTVPTSSCPATSQQSNWRPRGPPAAQPQQSDNRYGGQQSFQPRQPGFQPRPPTSMSNSFQTATPPVNRFNGPRPGFGRPRPGCLVCGTVGCHSDFHHQGPPPTPSRSQSQGPGMGARRRIGCYVCGRYGCHSNNHLDQSRGPPPQRSYPVPPTGNQSQGNSFRGPMAGSRAPSPDRPQSR